MNTRPDPLQERTPRLAYDFHRLLFSAAIGVPSAVAAVALYLAFSGTSLSAVAIFVSLFSFSAASSLAENAGKIGRPTRDRLLSNDDYREGVRAFMEKRQPSWPSLHSGDAIDESTSTTG